MLSEGAIPNGSKKVDSVDAQFDSSFGSTCDLIRLYLLQPVQVEEAAAQAMRQAAHYSCCQEAPAAEGSGS